MSTQTPSTSGLQHPESCVPAQELQDEPMPVSPTNSVSTGIQVQPSTRSCRIQVNPKCNSVGKFMQNNSYMQYCGFEIRLFIYNRCTNWHEAIYGGCRCAVQLISWSTTTNI